MKKLFTLEGKVAVVTGGASGIGESIVRLFAQQGAYVVVVDIDDAKGLSLAADIVKRKGKAIYHPTDITRQDRVFAVFNEIKSAIGPVDILVNNAGIAFVGNIEQTTEADIDRLYHVNIKGAYNCSLAAVRHMKGRGGCILNLASVAASVGLADRFAYSMTKGAMLTMTYALAKDYVHHGIRCNSIAPGRVHTPFVDGFIASNYPGQEEEMFEKLAQTQPIGRMARPEEIAHLALYLCSDEAAFITGSNYPIDGGFVTLNT